MLANYRRAWLIGADLRGRDLQGADLRGAFAHLADFRGANLRWALLYGLDLSGARLKGARHSLGRLPRVPDLARLAARDSIAPKLPGWRRTVEGAAIYHAGRPGRALSREIGPKAAAALIWQSSVGAVPVFYVGADEIDRAIRDALKREESP